MPVDALREAHDSLVPHRAEGRGELVLVGLVAHHRDAREDHRHAVPLGVTSPVAIGELAQHPGQRERADGAPEPPAIGSVRRVEEPPPVAGGDLDLAIHRHHAVRARERVVAGVRRVPHVDVGLPRGALGVPAELADAEPHPVDPPLDVGLHRGRRARCPCGLPRGKDLGVLALDDGGQPEQRADARSERRVDPVVAAHRIPKQRRRGEHAGHVRL